MTHHRRDKQTSGPVTQRHIAAITFVGALMVLWAAQSPVYADPVGAVQVFEKGYLYANHADDLADTSDGMTIEAWLWLTDLPGDKTYWPLTMNGGSHVLALVGPDRADKDHSCAGTAMFGGWYDSCSGVPNGPIVCVEWHDRPWPMGTWVHIAYQVKRNEAETYLDGERLSWNLGGCGAGRTDSPLFAAGLPEGSGSLALPYWEDPRRPHNMQGWIDEVRISKGWRYSAAGGMQPTLGEGPDGDTIALWTFDQAPGGAPYEDISGNGHTLFAGGSLAVTPSSRLAQTWAQLKRQ